MARPSGPVSDRADILPEAVEATLDAKLRGYAHRSGNAIVVASVPSLEGRPIENVALDTFNTWGIGGRKTNRGLLVLVAPNDRQMRIEVGCGLEKPISYDVAKQIIEQQMVPPFRSGDFPGGIDSGVDALIARLDSAKEFGATSEACLKIMKEAA
nr:TPM domain-containing protein [Parerythrobacter lacustris]